MDVSGYPCIWDKFQCVPRHIVRWVCTKRILLLKSAYVFTYIILVYISYVKRTLSFVVVIYYEIVSSYHRSWQCSFSFMHCITVYSISDLFATFVWLSGVISSQSVSNIIMLTVERKIHVWCISFAFQWVPVHVRWILICTEAFDMDFGTYHVFEMKFSGCPGMWDGFHWVPSHWRWMAVGTEALEMDFSGNPCMWDEF